MKHGQYRHSFCADDAWGWWLSRYPQFLATGEDKTPVLIPEPTTDEEAE